MRILVTGAAGSIGSHLAERLCGLGHEVIGIDSFTDYYATSLKELNARDIEAAGTRLLRLDLVTDDLRPAVRDAEVIFHLAGQPGISATTPLETHIRNNIVATQQLIEAARELPSLRCFANVSTSSVYGTHATDDEETPPKPTSFYGVTKLAAEQLVLASHRAQGLPACSLRLFSVYGPRERPEKLYHKLIKSILEGKEFPLHEGSESHIRSYTYIDDAIAGFISVLNRVDLCLGEIFNIGADHTITTGEGIRMVEEILGEKADKVIKPRRAGDQMKTDANIDKARRILGYEPTVSAKQGLRAQVAWYQERVFGKISY